MTIRDYIKRRMWTWGALAFGSWFFVSISGVLSKEAGHKAPPLMFVGVGLFAAVLLGGQFFIRCPNCKNRLLQTIAWRVAFQWGTRQRINFCPYCGVNLD